MKYFVSFVANKVGEPCKYYNCELETTGPLSFADIQAFEKMKRQKHQYTEVRVQAFQRLE